MDERLEVLKNYLLELIQEIQNIRTLKMVIRYLEHVHHKAD